MKCFCGNQKFQYANEILHHFALYHCQKYYQCGLNHCKSKKFDDFQNFRQHLNKIHSVGEISALNLRNSIKDPNSFFCQFFDGIPGQPTDLPTDLPSSQNADSAQDMNTPDDTIGPSQDNDFSFTRKFGKLAFKYSLSLNLSKTKQLEYVSRIIDLLATENPSPAALAYSREVFLNPYRIEEYLSYNFCKFNYQHSTVANVCEIFHVDLAQMFSHFLSLSSVQDFF